MYEPTMRGAWFRWSALDKRERRMVASSLTLFGIGAFLSLPAMGFMKQAYGLGYRIGSGGRAPTRPDPLDAIIAGSAGWWMALAAVLCVGLAVVIWIRFSRTQDELFNRVQNRSYGLGSFIAFGIMGLWLAAERLFGAPGLNISGVVLSWLAACTLVWIVDARRLWR